MIQLDYFPVIFLAVYIGQTVFNTWVEHINGIHAAKFSDKVPAGFEDFIDRSKLERISAYTREKSRLDIQEQIASDGVLLVIILSGLLPLLVRTFEAMGIPIVPAGLLFFLVPGAIQFLVELPFGYYHTFSIEGKFGFNRQSVKSWLFDVVKSLLLGLILSGMLLAALLGLLLYSPDFWWVWGFLIVSAVQFLAAVLYPVVIAPLFNKFEPVRDESLAGKILALMEENGIRVKKILQMDAGVRSRHTNAYFTGIGKTKQIVLFDTLLNSHTHEEILAVLAHEAGHFRRKHIVKQLVFFEALLLGGFYLTHLLLKYNLLYTPFGFDAPVSYAGLFLAIVLWQKAGFFLRPFYMELSRRFETEADIFAANMLGTSLPMLTALKRLAADNLSNLNPHPLYVWFHYSHPPIIERVAALVGIRLEGSEPEDLRTGGLGG
ncbi:MAG: M48 family metallopeptidase [Desulfobacteraceae bacterium]|nr:M48 family metallopeptidase [Desulfobacteraceae bacterium]